MALRFPFQQLSDTNRPYAEELKEAAARVIDSGWYLHGCETAALQQELSAALGEPQVQTLVTATGLDAIRLIFRAYMEMGRLKPGDEVIVPANTFIASALPLTELGLAVVPSEVKEEDFGLDFPKALERATPRTKAILTVHLYGTPCWDAEAAGEARRRGMLIVEDNAQAIGASITVDGKERMTGTLGDAAAFSFYPGKNIGALGDGGAIATRDTELLTIAHRLANYGSDKRYIHELLGYNCRLDEIQAAFLRIKLAHLQEESSHRDAAARAYSQSITNPSILTPKRIEGTRQVWHQYTVRSADRDRLSKLLEQEGVGTLIHYPLPIHRQPCYRSLSHYHLPIAEKLCREVLSLPIANISPTQATEIAEIINHLHDNS